MELESEFHIVIYDNEVDKNFTTVGHLIDFIQEKVDTNLYPNLN
jgi:acyl carrier protein